MAVLVVGLGNPLMSDDGLGVKVIEALSCRYRLGGAVSLVDGGTLGIDLLPRLAGVERLLIIDAVEMQAAPGTVRRLAGGVLAPALSGRLSLHQLGAQDLLALAELQGCLPPTVVVWGVQPESLALGPELTAPVAAAVTTVIDGVIGELRSWGIVCESGAREPVDPSGGAGR